MMEEYDDSPWSRDDLEALAWEVADGTDWDEYDAASEQPPTEVTWPWLLLLATRDRFRYLATVLPQSVN